MRHVLLLLLPVALSACAWGDDPSPIGRGYSSYNQEYKTPPGPTPDSLGYEYTKEVNEQIITEWRTAAADLLNTLESKTQIKNDIYLAPAPRMNALFSTFDHVLREELTARGYALSRTPSGSESLSYDAASADGTGLALLLLGEESTPLERYDGGIDRQKFILSLVYGAPAAPVATARSMYTMPESGYYVMDQVLRTSVPPDSEGQQK